MTRQPKLTSKSAAALRAGPARSCPAASAATPCCATPHPLYADHAQRLPGDRHRGRRADRLRQQHGLADPRPRPPGDRRGGHRAARARARPSRWRPRSRSQFAEHLCSRNDGFEKLRFVNSGTEAVMGALKAARAFTGRPKIAKVEGAYHGLYDYAEVSQTANPSNWGSADQPASVPVCARDAGGRAGRRGRHPVQRPRARGRHPRRAPGRDRLRAARPRCRIASA